MKKITIIIATYNAGKTIERCLDSVIPQKELGVELIIIDGKSNDDTLDKINKYNLYIDYLLSEGDKGIYDAWNKGIKMSTGEWLMFIGADDELMPNAISIYMGYLNCVRGIGRYDYICAHNNYIHKDGTYIKTIGMEPSWNNMRRYMSAAHVGSLHNRNLFGQVGTFDNSFSICADYELLLRKHENLKYLFIPETIAKMKEGGMSMSLKAIIETFKIRKKHQTVNIIVNCMIMIKSILFYKLYNFHK